MFHATCRRAYGSTGDLHQCDVDTTDPVLFVAHARETHKARRLTPDTLMMSTFRPWRTPSRKPFDPGPFDVGAWVTWESKGRTHTGQVWAVAGPRRRWVADGLAYHEVYDDQLVAAETGRAAA